MRAGRTLLACVHTQKCSHTEHKQLTSFDPSRLTRFPFVVPNHHHTAAARTARECRWLERIREHQAASRPPAISRALSQPPARGWRSVGEEGGDSCSLAGRNLED